MKCTDWDDNQFYWLPAYCKKDLLPFKNTKERDKTDIWHSSDYRPIDRVNRQLVEILMTIDIYMD